MTIGCVYTVCIVILFLVIEVILLKTLVVSLLAELACVVLCSEWKFRYCFPEACVSFE